MTATAPGSDGEARLSGESPPTLYAPSADVAVVAVGSGVYAVDLGAVGRPAPLPAMDRTRELGVLSFDRTPALRIGDADAASLVLDRTATLASVEMLGAADRVLSMSVDYAKDRVQFAKPIGSFQAVKHMLADAVGGRRGDALDGLLRRVVRGRWRSGTLVVRQHGQSVVFGRVTSGDGSRPPGARRHRLHVGALDAPLREAGAARSGELRRRFAPPGSHRRHPAGANRVGPVALLSGGCRRYDRVRTGVLPIWIITSCCPCTMGPAERPWDCTCTTMVTRSATR